MHDLTVADWDLDQGFGSRYALECDQLAGDDAAFQTFRRAPHVSGVIENTGVANMMDHLAHVIAAAPDLLEKKELLEEHEAVGGPDTGAPPGWPHLALAGTTCRYLGNVAMLRWIFGDSMAGWRLGEIGGGYGGLCHLVTKILGPESYTLYDLSSAIRLQQRYLQATNCPGVAYLSSVEDATYDLVISCCALSELVPDTMNLFGESVLARSPRGFITWSFSGGPVPGKPREPDEILSWLDGFSRKTGHPIVRGADVPEFNHLFGAVAGNAWPNYIFWWGGKA